MILNGKNYKRNELKKIGDEYYVKDETCFEIKGKWYPLGDLIALDHTTNKYNLKTAMLEGYVDAKKTIGWFTPTYRSINGEKVWRDFNDADKSLSVVDWKVDGKAANKHINKAYNLQYNYSDNAVYMQQILKAFDETQLDIHPITKENAWFLKGYSLGIELETNNGTLPLNVLNFCGLVPLKDGSLRLENGAEPFEYVTVPMRGVKGLQAIADGAYFLNHYCSFNHNCSLHVHIGGVRKDKLNILALYQLCYRIQNELFDIVPKYKRDPILYLGSHLPNGDARKNYAQPLPGLRYDKDWRKTFDSLFALSSGGIEMCQEVHRGSKHPEGKQKWNRGFRYLLMNVEHLLFDEGETVEFRLHPMTFNQASLGNWIALCVAIVRYAENNANEILKMDKTITLDTVIDGYATEFGTMAYNTKKGVFAENLKMYVREAKGRVYNSLLAKDYLGQGIAHTYDNPIFCSTFANNNLPEVSFYRTASPKISFNGNDFMKHVFEPAIKANPFDDDKVVNNEEVKPVKKGKAQFIKLEPVEENEEEAINEEDDDIFDLGEEEVINELDVENFKVNVLDKVKEIEKKLIENEIVA